MHTSCIYASTSIAMPSMWQLIIKQIKFLLLHPRDKSHVLQNPFFCYNSLKSTFRPDKLDLLFLISHLLDLGAGGRLLFITSLFKGNNES